MLPPIRTVIVVERTSEHDWRAEYINFPDPTEVDPKASITIIHGHMPNLPVGTRGVPAPGDWAVTCQRLGEV